MSLSEIKRSYYQSEAGGRRKRLRKSFRDNIKKLRGIVIVDVAPAAHCGRQKPTDSHHRRRLCQSKYPKDARALWDFSELASLVDLVIM